MEVVYLKILSDIHCEVYVDNEMKVVAPKNTLTKIQLLQGEYYVQLVSTVNPNYKIERVVSLDYDKVLNVQFSEIVRLHPEYLRDTDVIWIRDNQSYKAKNLVSGKIISDAYDYVNAVNDFKNGISIVYKNKLVGVVDIQGKEVIPCSFEAIEGIYGRNILSGGIEDIAYGLMPRIASESRNWIDVLRCTVTDTKISPLPIVVNIDRGDCFVHR